jgi:rare lipoprotein A
MTTTRLRAFAVLAGVLLLAACAQTPPRREDHTPATTTTAVPPPAPPAVPAPDGKPARRGNPPFYDALGRRYHVLPSEKGYRERGVASWYGGEFHGRLTASGEPYDMHALTAAHKTLPLPCYAKVTNLRNGRSVIVRVNDRGPFVRNRIIDLSLGAAEVLDITHDGTGLVEVEVIEYDADQDGALAGTPPALDGPGATLVPDPGIPLDPPIEARTLYVQVGAFGDPFNAERMRQRLASLGFDNVNVATDTANGRTLYRVRLGPLPDVDSYDKLVERLTAAAIDDIYLTLD